jgi:uncharacterized protein
MTIITGDLATARATEEIVAYIADNFDGVEVEVHAGGQPLYPLILFACGVARITGDLDWVSP